ncbi:MAG: LacI family DNA-binding transcriptional regulator [Bacilli bacterium]
MANLRDVALNSGVSLTTALKILSNDQSFKASLATKEKVLQAAKDLNYTYQSKSKKSFKIGVILAQTSQKYGDPYFSSILSSLEANGARYNINITIIKDHFELQDEIKKETFTSLDGLLLMETISLEELKQLEKQVKYIIGIDQNLPMINNVSFDQVQANKLAMQHLIDLNHKNIAYIGGSSLHEDLSSSIKMMVYREALFQANLSYNPNLVFDTKWDIKLCEEITTNLMKSNIKVDAIFAGSDSLASIILGKLHSLGYVVPRDISVIGFNNITLSAHLIPPLTTIAIPCNEIGFNVIHRFSELFSNGLDQCYSITLPVALIIRQSTLKRQ